MEKKKYLDVIVCITGLVVLIGAVAVMFLHSDGLRGNTVAKQLSAKYGITVSDAGVNFDGDHFVFLTDEGIRVSGTCGFFGKVKSDTYVNYYYAEDVNAHIEELVGGCFTDYIVIKDDMHASELGAMEFNTGKIRSYGDYVSAADYAFKHDELNSSYWKISVRVYLRETEDTSNIVEAVNILKDAQEPFDVYFYKIPDDLFDYHRDMGLFCYCRSTVMDKMANMPALLELIYHNEGLAGRYRLWKDTFDIKDSGEWREI